MIKRTVADRTPYEAPGHFGVSTMRIHGKNETGAEKFSLGFSTFLPGGGADYSGEDSPTEKVYYVLSGEMTVRDKDGNETVLHANETISIKPHEGRSIKNETNEPVTMLVIISY